MWEGTYGKEPFDLRLTVLRMLRRLWQIAAVTLAGTLVFGGGYYVKNILLQSEPAYSATSIYRVEYAVEDEKDVSTVHINETTWNTYVDTQMFLDAVRSHLSAGTALTDSQLTEALNAVLASDLKVLSTTVTTDSPEESLEIAAAVEAAMVQDFPSGISEVLSISVIDHAREALEVYPDVRPVRALVLSAILSFFFIVVILLLKELGDDSVWLPASISRRYGLKTVGTLSSPVLIENIRYLFFGHKRNALCPVQEGIDPEQVLEKLRRACEATEAMGGTGEWFVTPSPMLCPESCQALREADGILLAVSAGPHAGKQLECTMEFLGQQECKITAVILIDEDELLLRAYYGFHQEKR